MKWKPATVEQVRQINPADLKNCNRDRISAFEVYAVEPYLASMRRYGKLEYVVSLHAEEQRLSTGTMWKKVSMFLAYRTRGRL